ncbi:lipopolysaccharide assembly protein LapA domain-containing protein [Halotalea alkalilenta]|uniref:Lipopolysaccharide assembly protein A domain-containing protein n=1 Tax=Halotalea alkalilenta TaxID=376489 RepID=A0A172YEA8_9GAMM|nr:lipopolysaccharide assembly protein LapA domain-containing protein [Halotalea alkalilenta]ANF57573.1 hypothetical protein A5892_08935 [Halotalea alkalilenta]
MRWLKGLLLAIISLVVVLFGILFAVRNQQAIPLDVIWIELPPASLALWLLATLLLGVILGMAAMTGLYVRLRSALARSRRENRQQQLELDRLRTQGLKESH